MIEQSERTVWFNEHTDHHHSKYCNVHSTIDAISTPKYGVMLIVVARTRAGLHNDREALATLQRTSLRPIRELLRARLTWQAAGKSRSFHSNCARLASVGQQLPNSAYAVPICEKRPSANAALPPRQCVRHAALAHSESKVQLAAGRDLCHLLHGKRHETPSWHANRHSYSPRRVQCHDALR